MIDFFHSWRKWCWNQGLPCVSSLLQSQYGFSASLGTAAGHCPWLVSLPVVLRPHWAQHAGAEVPLLNSSEDFMPCVVLAWLWCLLVALGSSVSFCVCNWCSSLHKQKNIFCLLVPLFWVICRVFFGQKMPWIHSGSIRALVGASVTPC